MRILSLADLKARGITFTRQHLHKLSKQGKFPRPIKLGENKNGWPEEDIDNWIKERIAERDCARAA